MSARPNLIKAVKQLKLRGIYVFISQPSDYQAMNKEILLKLTKTNGMRGIYATLNKPYNQIKGELEKRGIDTGNIFS